MICPSRLTKWCPAPAPAGEGGRELPRGRVTTPPPSAHPHMRHYEISSQELHSAVLALNVRACHCLQFCTPYAACCK